MPVNPPAVPVRQPSWLLWSTIPAILIVVAFGLWLRLNVNGPTTVDQSWLNLVGLEPDTALYWMTVVLAVVGGGTGVVICTGLLVAIFVVLRRFRAAGYLASAMLLGIGLSELLKAIVTRVRPSDQLYDSLGYSYPSGHSMGAAALAMSLAIIVARAHMLRVSTANANAQLADAGSTAAAQPAQAQPGPARDVPVRLRFNWSMAVAAVWILTMMWSRTALQVHWLSDTIAGALIGISAAVLADELWTVVTLKTRSPRLQR